MTHPPALTFELLNSNDGHYAKRARVLGGYIYLFCDWDDEAGHSRATATCFVPDPPFPGPKFVKLTADDFHELTKRYI